MTARARAPATAISIALLAAAASPVVRAPIDDGFPLSTYPMFAVPRPTRMAIDYAIGETAAAEHVTLSPALIGSREVLQARVMLGHAIAHGGDELAQTCARIAANVAADRELTAVVAIRIVTGTHDAVDYLVRHVVGVERERARCAVNR